MLQVVQIVILELKLELSVILYSSYMNKAMESNFGTKCVPQCCLYAIFLRSERIPTKSSARVKDAPIKTHTDDRRLARAEVSRIADLPCPYCYVSTGLFSSTKYGDVVQEEARRYRKDRWTSSLRRDAV